ncbi:leucine-rich repeat-containing protein 24 isoform X2 [Siniperca chuatsi]|uniref:leucine-rich repeat-containing protein 24 isoform X2 n=1 Tax=Siniperca chuatsi TaxID=119488 RepID=UPI001CE13E68|nr:leucine-rich repeat-containing protein 24 isoform X2 [Siniperca chuatsi]
MPAGGCTMLCVTPLLPLLLNTVLGFKLCPSHCLCYESSDLVDCRNRGLVRVPPSVPHGTWLLDLSGNKLTEVRTGSFMGLWSLKILLMSKNSIQSLQPQELRLDHNLLQYLDSTSLVDFENLRRLDLSYNRIRAMDVRAFGSLSRLSLLNLEGNGLYVLQDGLLCRQQSLEVLLLSHNNISVIETEALAPLRSLTLLSLQGNQLKHIRFKTFLKLQTTTTHLQMSSNPWICDCELQRVFSKIQHVRHLRVLDYKDIVCHAPAQQAGSSLASLDSQLCIAETASVLVITITVMLAVIGALVKAEYNRKNKQTVSDTESERQEK